VNVEIDDSYQAMTQAQKFLDDKKKDQARARLQQALREHPKSPRADEVKKMLASIK
jgi:ribosomal protein L29